MKDIAAYAMLIVCIGFIVHLSHRVTRLESEASARSLMARRIPITLRP